MKSSLHSESVDLEEISRTSELATRVTEVDHRETDRVEVEFA
jgi:hypothetical protein